MYLSLPIKESAEKQHIENLIQDFLARELLLDMLCPKCKNKTVYKNVKIW